MGVGLFSPGANRWENKPTASALKEVTEMIATLIF